MLFDFLKITPSRRAACGNVRMVVLFVMSVFCCQWLFFIHILKGFRQKIYGHYDICWTFLGGDIRSVSLLFDQPTYLLVLVYKSKPHRTVVKIVKNTYSITGR